MYPLPEHGQRTPKKAPAPSVTERPATLRARIALELHIVIERQAGDEELLSILGRNDLTDEQLLDELERYNERRGRHEGIVTGAPAASAAPVPPVVSVELHASFTPSELAFPAIALVRLGPVSPVERQNRGRRLTLGASEARRC